MAKSSSDRVEIAEEGARIGIRMPYNEEFIKKIKAIQGRRWDAERRAWTVPTTSEYRARKIVKECFPAQAPEAWKETAADEIRGHVLLYMPDGSSLSSRVIEEEDGSTVVSLSRPDAPELEEANIIIEDDFGLREAINGDEAEEIAKKLQERKSCWIGWE
ncbi:MAG: hypothetical protein ABSF82_14635 [Candidatus Bathyarchaeia archaeon]